ncbi:MAG: methylmalonyl Co-A mutase-associated GTPase MeaB [Flavobacteriaceae bacterium]|nr:methylmalonyl Co-A mutase-associated GTPase MeaB [Flavobacteriaceae bacterium]
MNKKEANKSALNEKKGVAQPKSISLKVASTLKTKRIKVPATKELIKGILKKDKTALSRSITLVESTVQKHQDQAREIIETCLTHANNSIRIGITGVPGVGKSTFIEQFGTLLAQKNHKVAVLAVDPSSSISGGSILGDKTRMGDLVREPNSFIRPSASRNSLGGVARNTREAIILCEAAGYNIILIETVGVGQSETVVHSMTDFFLLLKLAGAGDELQGIKRGIIEMADSIVINKADGNNITAAQLAKTEFNRALHLYPDKGNDWTPKTLTCSALHNEGVSEIWELIQKYNSITKENGYFQQKRNDQNRYWLLQTIESTLKSDFYNQQKIKEELKKQLILISENKTTPFEAANYLLTIR